MSALLPAKPGNATELLAATENRSGYRDYDQPGIERVRQFYRDNHTHQTYAFGQEKRAKWLKFDQR
jgi:inositol oxygenase